MRTTRSFATFAVALSAMLGACADAPTSVPAAGQPTGVDAASRVFVSGGVPQYETFQVCKSGSSASFSYTADYASNGAGQDEAGTFTLQDGECATILQRGGTGATVTVTETSSQAGYALDRVDLTSAVSATIGCGAQVLTTTTSTGPTVSGIISGSASGTIPCKGVVAHFYNKFIPVGQIGDFVWNDANNNGIQDLGEFGIPGVLVTLGGDASATATTDANGNYLFTGLSAGNYTVTVGAGPTGYTASPADQGGDDATDSDGLPPVNVTLATDSSVDLTIDFGFAPPPPPPAGCTLTIGFWKTHAGFTGKNADVVTQHLPQWLGTSGGAASVQVTTAAQAVSILSMTGGASNGIVKLKAQLLGAKLNIASGASSSAIAATVAAADAFLASNAASAWSSLSSSNKAKVNAWMSTLDDYNNGLVGPGHCGSTGI